MHLSGRQFKLLAGAAIAAIIIVGGVWLMKSTRPKEGPVNPEITLEPSKQITAELAEPMTPEEKQAIEDIFAKEGVEMTLLQDVSGIQLFGTAWRLFDGTKYYHKIEAGNLADPEKGYFYEGWLVGDSGFFTTGRLAVAGGKGTLYYVSGEDKTNFRGVVLTLENEDGDPAPGKHILEGSF